MSKRLTTHLAVATLALATASPLISASTSYADATVPLPEPPSVGQPDPNQTLPSPDQPGGPIKDGTWWRQHKAKFEAFFKDKNQLDDIVRIITTEENARFTLELRYLMGRDDARRYKLTLEQADVAVKLGTAADFDRFVSGALETLAVDQSAWFADQRQRDAVRAKGRLLAAITDVKLPEDISAWSMHSWNDYFQENLKPYFTSLRNGLTEAKKGGAAKFDAYLLEAAEVAARADQDAYDKQQGIQREEDEVRLRLWQRCLLADDKMPRKATPEMWVHAFHTQCLDADKATEGKPAKHPKLVKAANDAYLNRTQKDFIAKDGHAAADADLDDLIKARDVEEKKRRDNALASLNNKITVWKNQKVRPSLVAAGEAARTGNADSIENFLKLATDGVLTTPAMTQSLRVTGEGRGGMRVAVNGDKVNAYTGVSTGKLNQPLANASWYVLEGRAEDRNNACVSFMTDVAPNQRRYITLGDGGTVIASAADDSTARKNQTFCAVDGVTKGTFRFEALAKPGFFLRSFAQNIVSTDARSKEAGRPDSAAGFVEDSTFAIETGSPIIFSGNMNRYLSSGKVRAELGQMKEEVSEFNGERVRTVFDNGVLSWSQKYGSKLVAKELVDLYNKPRSINDPKNPPAFVQVTNDTIAQAAGTKSMTTTAGVMVWSEKGKAHQMTWPIFGSWLADNNATRLGYAITDEQCDEGSCTTDFANGRIDRLGSKAAIWMVASAPPKMAKDVEDYVKKNGKKPNSRVVKMDVNCDGGSGRATIFHQDFDNARLFHSERDHTAMWNWSKGVAKFHAAGGVDGVGIPMGIETQVGIKDGKMLSYDSCGSGVGGVVWSAKTEARILPPAYFDEYKNQIKLGGKIGLPISDYDDKGVIKFENGQMKLDNGRVTVTLN